MKCARLMLYNANKKSEFIIIRNIPIVMEGRRGRDRLVVGFRTADAISATHP
jgi:hypothetical protein